MMPKADKLIILAEHFKVPINYFLEETEKEDS
nr:MAG TPA: protein-turn-helix DNA binding protein [Caudoviricetes sp.]